MPSAEFTNGRNDLMNARLQEARALEIRGLSLPQYEPEMIIDTDGFVMISGNGNLPLAHEIGNILLHEVDTPVGYFADGEPNIRSLRHNLRRREAVIMQTCQPPHIARDFLDMLQLIDAAKRGSCQYISVVAPYLPMTRGDRKALPRTPIPAALLMKLIREAGGDHLMTSDIHARQEVGMFDGPMDNLEAGMVLADATRLYMDDPANTVAMTITEGQTEDIGGSEVVLGPDIGSIRNAKAFAGMIGTSNIAVAFKTRDLHTADKIDVTDMLGDVEGKQVFIIDDIGNTISTLRAASNEAKRRGATSVVAAITHGLFVGEALKNLDESAIDRLIVTNTINHRDEVRQHPRIQVVSVAHLFADAIWRNYIGGSISESDMQFGGPRRTR